MVLARFVSGWWHVIGAFRRMVVRWCWRQLANPLWQQRANDHADDGSNEP
jgi:hypothetical protein